MNCGSDTEGAFIWGQLFGGINTLYMVPVNAIFYIMVIWYYISSSNVLHCCTNDYVYGCYQVQRSRISFFMCSHYIVFNKKANEPSARKALILALVQQLLALLLIIIIIIIIIKIIIIIIIIIIIVILLLLLLLLIIIIIIII